MPEPSATLRAAMRMTAAKGTLAVIGLLTLVNLLVHPSFLGPSNDWLGDFLKLTLSYPGGWDVHSQLLPSIVEKYKVRGVIDALAHRPDGTWDIVITHFHEPPLATLIPLLAVRLMRVMDPVLVYLTLAAAIVGYTALVAASVGRTRGEKLTLALIAIVAYPTLFTLDRGNMFAGLSSALVLHAVLLSVRGRGHWVSAILLALAMNLRPNLVVFLLPVVAFASPWRWRLVPVTIIAAVGVFFGVLAIDHALYPDYSLASFKHGLELYSQSYVLSGNDGIAGGSSLFTPLKLMSGPVTASVVSLAVGATLGALAIWLCFKQADRAVISYFVCAALALGTGAFGDYHLTVFMLPLLAALADSRPMSPARSAVLIASAIVLAPKNIWFFWLDPFHPVSYQVWINPLVLLAGAIIAAWPGFAVKRTVAVPVSSHAA